LRQNVFTADYAKICLRQIFSFYSTLNIASKLNDFFLTELLLSLYKRIDVDSTFYEQNEKELKIF
jgi:hypothetical protein